MLEGPWSAALMDRCLERARPLHGCVEMRMRDGDHLDSAEAFDHRHGRGIERAWTPHISGGEPEYMIKEAEVVLSNIAKVFHGKPPEGRVAEFRA
jgi:lactate dehydrogenase-like 2-hydroxyacid dehydrogenase